MKLIVAGSRSITITPDFLTECAQANNLDVVQVVSGMARGVDHCGEKWARACGYELMFFPADWNTYGKSAGYRRNSEMAAYADALLLVWDGESKGSGHMRDIMLKLGKPVYEVVLAKENV